VPVWAVANQKGGVGKTTTAISLGGLLARRGHRSLLIDLDPHGSLTSYFKIDPETVTDGLYTVFERAASGRPIEPDLLVRDTCVPGLRLLPASTALATLDRQFGAREGMGLILSRMLSKIADAYECVLADCPPVLGVLLVNALAACDRLIIPVQTEFLALKGLERMIRTLAMITRTRKQPLPYLIVPTLFDRRTRASVDCLENLRAHYRENLWEGVIPIDTQLREASRAGVPVAQAAPSARGTQAYESLLDRLWSYETDSNRRALRAEVAP
jgi:chromosome partitioning protein